MAPFFNPVRILLQKSIQKNNIDRHHIWQRNGKGIKEGGSAKRKDLLHTRDRIVHNGSKTESVSFPHCWGFTVYSTTSTVTYTSLLLFPFRWSPGVYSTSSPYMCVVRSKSPQSREPKLHHTTSQSPHIAVNDVYRYVLPVAKCG